MINNVTAGFTREAWIEKRVAEGFTKEQAGNEYDNYTDPAIKQAQEQKVPTRGEVLQNIAEARQNNLDKAKLYKPNFKWSADYKAVQKEIEGLDLNTAEGIKKGEELSKRLLAIQISGTVTDEERQAEVDKSLEMPIAQIIAECKKYEKVVLECEDKIDNFDVSPVQAKVDVLDADYKKKCRANAGRGSVLASIQKEYDDEVDKLEMEYIKKPINDLAVKRYEAKEYFLIYEARLKYFITANKDLIEEEIQQAKREEVRGSLVDLVGYMEE